ncbi:hypothetical protein [Microlunatus soli]|uniref:Uncharacterized protein n=1 Tax=Microlunatus soli TaxID=630515 RepID=A0A1H1Q6S0_9ACTN|nr:hypothetical protein [Microlunatus soli]SDS19208.1 hypothetical protein SAMN04489812_1163 [Microlunatus soli]
MVPLNVLLSAALLDLTRECERQGAEEVVLWSNLLRVIDDDGVDVRELPGRVRLSRRAVRSMTGAVERSGWATRDGKIIRLNEPASRARRRWGAAISHAEQEWTPTSLRAPLESFVSQLPLEYSHYPCGYGAADSRITGNGKSGLERHGAVTVDRSHRVQLTPLGIRVRDGYRPGVRAVERALPGAAALRDSLEALELPAHPRHPDVRYVGGRVGFAEVSARRDLRHRR